MSSNQPINISKTAKVKINTCISAMLAYCDSTPGSKQAGLLFFAYMLLQVNRRPDNSIPTMALSYNINTFSPELLYNENFTLSLSMPELIGVLVHEMIHLAHLHINRRNNRNPSKWNIACDMAVNNIIEKMKASNAKINITLPSDCIKPIPNVKHESVEFYYLLIKDNPNSDSDGDENSSSSYTFVVSPDQSSDGKGSSGKGNTGSSNGDHSKWATFEDVSSDAINAKVQSILKSSSIQAGNIPGDLKDLITGLNQPKISWYTKIRMFTGNNIKISSRRSWQRPSRRIPAIKRNGMIQPQAQGKLFERSGTIGVIQDVSGSVPDNDIRQFFSEIDKISKTHLVKYCTCDTKVSPITKYSHRNYVHSGASIVGRGGTDMNPAIKLMNSRPDIDMVIVFTDGWLFSTPEPINKPHLWVITSNGTTKHVAGSPHVKMD